MIRLASMNIFSNLVLRTFPAILIMMYSGCGSSVDIWNAVESEDLALIESYVKGGGNLEVGSSTKEKTPLLHAIKFKKIESYKKLLALGANPNTVCRGGNVPMHKAALMKDSFWLRDALAAGGDPNVVNEGASKLDKTTPLICAIAVGSLENVKLLVKAGADLDDVDGMGETPLSNASDFNEFEVVYYLLEAGADYQKPALNRSRFIFSFAMKNPDFGNNPEQKRARIRWHGKVVEWLAARGVDPSTIPFEPVPNK